MQLRIHGVKGLRVKTHHFPAKDDCHEFWSVEIFVTTDRTDVEPSLQLFATNDPQGWAESLAAGLLGRAEAEVRV